MDFLNCSVSNSKASTHDSHMTVLSICMIVFSTVLLAIAGIVLWCEYRQNATLPTIYILIRRVKRFGSLGDAPPQPIMDNLMSGPTIPDPSRQMFWVANQIHALGLLQMTLTLVSPVLGCLPKGDLVGHAFQSVMIVIAYTNISYILEDMKGIDEVLQQHVEGHLSGSMGGCIAKRVSCCCSKSRRLVKFVLKLLSLPIFINGVTTGLIMKASFDMMFELHSNASDAISSMLPLLVSWSVKMALSALAFFDGARLCGDLDDAATSPSLATSLCYGAGLDMPRKVFTSVAKATGYTFSLDELSEFCRLTGLIFDVLVIYQKMIMVYKSALSGGDETKRQKVLLAILVGLASLAGNASIITNMMSEMRTFLFQKWSTSPCSERHTMLLVGALGLVLVRLLFLFSEYFYTWLSCTDDLSKMARAFGEMPVEMLTTLGVPICVIAALSYFG